MKAIWNFLKVRKKWWILAGILFIILLAIIILFPGEVDKCVNAGGDLWTCKMEAGK